MRYPDIQRHLKPYRIKASRTTTINHAFAAAIATCDSYDEARVIEAILALGQDPNDDLLCAYCGSRAETWDHVYATVRNREFSGYGHRLGNLLPSCKPCNSRKGNKFWSDYLNSLTEVAETDRDCRGRLIKGYLEQFAVKDNVPADLPEYVQLREIRNQILDLFDRADRLANQIRVKESELFRRTPPHDSGAMEDEECAHATDQLFALLDANENDVPTR